LESGRKKKSFSSNFIFFLKIQKFERRVCKPKNKKMLALLFVASREDCRPDLRRT
jgi:hypothetical protein